MRSDLCGGRHGPLDACRHALASATVAWTLGDWAVNLTTAVFESSGKETGRMDRHNNRIGAVIGSQARSFSAIEPSVRAAVLNGCVSASDPDRITWLPPAMWRDDRLW